MKDSPLNIETLPVAGEAYLKSHKFARHTHATKRDEHDVPVALCGRVQSKNLLDDALWDGPGSTQRKPTCPHCLKLDPRQRAELAELADKARTGDADAVDRLIDELGKE